MQFQHFALLACMLATQAFAMPTELARRDWVSNSKGNLIITFSDQTVKLGTIPISVIMSSMGDACSTQGLCDTTPIDITGYQLIDGGLGGSVYDETLTITPSGDYPTWIHNGLLEALQAAIGAAKKCSQVTNTPTCPDPESYCPETPETVTECVVPQFWGVTYQPANLGNAAPPYMDVGLAITVDEGDFCSTFTTIGGAVAGAVNGAAGGIFTLLSLACH